MDAQADNWDDLRIFLAVARQGSLSGASRTLGVNHSTVFRRITAFEEALKVRLFDRLPTGYTMTAAGEEMFATAQRIEEELAVLGRHIAGQDVRLSGTIRLTTVDSLATGSLPRHIAAFRSIYPDIDFELVVASEVLDLSKREADVAIRTSINPPETLVGRAIADVAFAIYASTDYLAGLGGRAADELDWVVADESAPVRMLGRMANQLTGKGRVVLRTNSVNAIAAAVLDGLGVALLPCWLGDTKPALRRIGPLVANLKPKLWLLTHEDLRRTARIRAFLEFMGKELTRDRDLIEGRRPFAPAWGEAAIEAAPA